MKKAFRVIIPITLVIAIVLCLAWYLLEYDREFTRDALLGAARKFESNGNHKASSWMYECAYRLSEDNDSVAIELANQHKASGNYTQAEYTLSHAIADGGGIDLYVELCKVYVEQNKLLDAVAMLDNIHNADIKAQIEKIRPAAPTTDTDPGFYSQYMSVNITADNGTLYVTTDGKYPSVKSQPYSKAINLKEGENTIYALSISENGLVSPLSIFGYTIRGVIEELSFADPAIEAAVRNLLRIPENKNVFTNDLWTITSFTVPSEATSFDDLRNFVFLEELTVISGASNQMQSLSGLANLKKLTVKDTPVSTNELNVIGNLPMLKELVLSGCNLTTTGGLENADKLTRLDLSSNTIRSIYALSKMPELEHLYLQDNTIIDLSPISGCSKLTNLDISSNAIESLAPVCEITSLRWLNAADNKLTDISGLGNLSKLNKLSLANNQIADIAPIAPCVNLVDLDLSNNLLTDISVLSNMHQLTQFNFSYNEVTELPEWPKNASLVHIDGSHNLITSVDVLSGMEYLNNVYMDYNPELKSIKSLAKCHVLIRVNVYGTKVTEVRELTDMSVIVNYDPTQK